MRLDLMLHGSPPAANTEPQLRAVKPQASKLDKTEFDQLLETLYDAVVLTDYNGCVTTVNQRALVFFQTENKAILRCGISQLISGLTAEILETVRENISADRYTLMQALCIRADTSTFPAEISVTSVVRHGQASLCFSIRDITVRREVEERLRIEGEAIRNAGDGIVITDTEGMITYANPAVAQLWNLENQDHLIGQAILELFPDTQWIETIVNDAVQEGSWRGDLEGARPDAKPLFLHAHITGSRDENQCITHLIFSFADITRRRQGEIALIEYQNHLEDLIRERTVDLESANADLKKEVEERKLVERQLREAIQKLREHDKAKSSFVSNVSHELRTPLTSLITSLENLMHGVVVPVSKELTSYFNMMLEDCWRLERTINDILDLSRMENGTLHLRRAPVPFARLMRRTAESIRISAEAIPLKFHVSYDNFAGYADCDGLKMARVLQNILSNAIKFTPPYGICRVDFKQITRQGQQALACDILDSGVGIPPECIERVTERFFRVGEQVEGTGLGLHIAKEITERHGGSIEIQSPPQGQKTGTLVRLWLPALPPAHILLALPETDHDGELRTALANRGYRVDCTANGTEAVQKLRDDHHAAALIGAQLADMSGTETIMHIKADAALRGVRLFYLAETPLDATKNGLLQGFQIPVIMMAEDTNLLINKIEDHFLPEANRLFNIHNNTEG